MTKQILAPQPESGDSVVPPTPSVLMLIHNGNLSIAEAIVATVFPSNEVLGDMTILLKWDSTGNKTKAFQTSKDLKELEKELKAKDMVVYLHEVDNNFKKCKHLSCDCRQFEIKKPLMLAVFGDSKIVKEMV